MLNQEQAALPELQLLCGVINPDNDFGSTQAAERNGTFGSDIAELTAILHEHNNFDPPSLDLFLGLHALSGLSALIDVDVDSAGVIVFEDLGQCVHAISDLDALNLLLKQVDSPGFAMWCGSHSSTARSLLTSLRERIDARIKLVRSVTSVIDVITAANPQSVKILRRQIRQASILGVPVRTVQLLWSKNFTSAQLKKWSSQLTKAGAGTVLVRSGGSPRELTTEATSGFTRGRALKPGTLLELTPTEYLYVMSLKRVGALKLNIGILENNAVIEYQGVRRIIGLPAACSRMQAHNVTLSSEHISIYFTVKEDLWPNMENTPN